MTWIEIIKIRSTPEDLETIVRNTDLARLRDTARLPVTIDMFRHQDVDTDMAIHINWDSDDAPTRSLISESILEIVKDYGLVNHSIWFRPEKEC